MHIPTSSHVISSLLPQTVAVVDPDMASNELLEQSLLLLGVQASVFGSAEDLLVGPTPFDFDQYVIEVALPDIDGMQLLRTLRKRTQAGVLLTVANAQDDIFVDAVENGADMLLVKPLKPEHAIAALKAIHRRSSASSGVAGGDRWLLDRAHSRLFSPSGVPIELSATDFAVMECFWGADGAPVSKSDLNRRIGRVPTDDMDNALHAIIYRLRKRIERTTGGVVPLHTVAGVGYVFKGYLSQL